MSKKESNRRNAKLSTGPRTQNGLAKSSKNAMKHGLASQDTVLAHESIAAFRELYESMTESLSPFDQFEKVLVERIVNCTWRLKRIMRIEASMFDWAAEESANADFMRALEFAGISRENDLRATFNIMERGHGTISNLTKYEAHCERSLYRALHELERRQAIRRGATHLTPIAVDVEVSGEGLTQSDKDQVGEVGFVLEKTPR